MGFGKARQSHLLTWQAVVESPSGVTCFRTSHSFRRKAVAVMSRFPGVAIFPTNPFRTPKIEAGPAAAMVEKLIELFPERPVYMLPAKRFVRENPPPFQTLLCPAFESLVDV